MCGIAGLFSVDREARVDPDLMRAMGDTLAHRGPDGSGVRVGRGYGLAHRRLSIVDLDAGTQPMSDDRCELWVTYNGEIYNFESLRRELEQRGHVFHTRCDTEVLLYGYREWGEALPERLRGMFAFAIVDERDGTLFAARDRIGKKPFYWAEVPSGFLFGSEMKALLAYPELQREIDPVALEQFFCLRYVPDPRTIFAGVHKLPPGTCMKVAHGEPPRLRRYWRLSFARTDTRPAADLAEELLERIDDAVRVRLMGDVPVGAFLSGGVDSYAIVESMARSSDGPVVACAIGFTNSSDELAGARRAAAACGATLHEGMVEAEDLLDQTWFSETFDEPFADSTAIPNYHVSRLTRRHVKVALSGDGGDEPFAGYRRYKFDVIENRIRGWLPRALWAGLGVVYPKLDPLPRWMRFKRTFQNLARTPSEAYARSVSSVLPEELAPILRPQFRTGADPLAPIRRAYDAADGPDALARAAAADFETWLPGDILTKVDRTSMAMSLEVRAPLLDHLLLEFAARIPSALKLAGGKTKSFLRRALASRLDAEALARRKRGFNPPTSEWLRGRVGDGLERALGSPPLDEVVDTAAVRKLLGRHRAGTSEQLGVLWATLAFDRFQRRWL